MNLLFYVPQMAAYGGMERHVCVLAEEAIQRGHHVRLITTSNSLNEATRIKLVGFGVQLRELRRKRDSARVSEKMLWLMWQTLLAASTKWDLIYTNGQSSLSRTVWRAARSSTRIVHHHHTAGDPEEQKSWAPGFWKVLQTAPEIVACSEATRLNLEKAVGRKGIRFLPYFAACPVAKAAVTEKKYAPGQPLSIGFVGRLVRTKGIDTLCQLSLRPELKNIRWQIYGAGPEYTADHFKAFPNLRYHGPYRDLAHYGQILLELDALALFSQHNEGMPLSLIEAMSAGLPWIASDRGGTRELAEGNQNCMLVQRPTELDQVLVDTSELIRRIHEGMTSRLAQRAIYDRDFAPPVVSRKWFDYIEGGSRSPTEG